MWCLEGVTEAWVSLVCGGDTVEFTQPTPWLSSIPALLTQKPPCAGPGQGVVGEGPRPLWPLSPRPLSHPASPLLALPSRPADNIPGRAAGSWPGPPHWD